MLPRRAEAHLAGRQASGSGGFICLERSPIVRATDVASGSRGFGPGLAAYGRKAMALPGPPEEPPIFRGRKTKKAPRTGSSPRFVRIST